MIDSISIENYRGIRTGELQDLPRIAVLTGPNGCGKSSVLEALQIGGNQAQLAASVLQRRSELPNPGRWLIHRGEIGTAVIRVKWTNGSYLEKRLDSYGLDALTQQSGTTEDFRDGALFIEQRMGRLRQELHQLFTETRRRSGVNTALELLAEVDPTIRNLEILTEGNTPILHLAYDDRVVPASLAGDGMESLIRLALELSQRKQGVFLLEEPEAHMHSAAILRSANIIVAAARSGCQVILSTHSMEFLDDMLAGLTDDELALLAVYRLRLIGGVLKVHRMPGVDVNAARTEIEDDLR